MLTDLWVEGVIVEFKNGEPCNRAIIRQVGKSEIVFANILNGTICRMERTALDEMKESGGIKFLAESRDFGDLKFFDLTEVEQLEVNRRYKYIKALLEKGINKVTEKSAGALIQDTASVLGEKPPHWQSVRSWHRNYIAAGERLRGLYSKNRFKGRRESRLDSRVINIIQKEAKPFFKQSQPTMASIERNIEAKILAHNLDHPDDLLQMPSYVTIQRRILNTSYQVKQKSRKGVRAFQAELAKAESGIKTSRILERVEIDHTLLDIHVLHDDHKTLLGRPNITVLIDHYSHMVLGFQLSFEKPSFASVCTACMNAFLPKEAFLESLSCDGSWPAHGIPDTLVSDNGSEFWGNNFIAVADEIGSLFQYCPVRKGNYKSRVERFFGKINSFVLDDLPGVVRKPGKCGESYDARQEAKMTYTEFKQYFVTWLTEVHHNVPLEDTGMTPNELWCASEAELPVPVEDEMELTPILMATDTRELSKGGIRIFVLDYSSSILRDLYRRDGPGTVTIKYNPFDIGYILVLDSVNNVYLKVNCENYTYASGLSLFEHNKIRAEVKKVRNSKLENSDLQRAKIKLAKERENAHARNGRRKTQTTASNAARSEKVGVNDIKLVIDNSKKIVQLDDDSEEDDINMDGWSVD